MLNKTSTSKNLIWAVQSLSKNFCLHVPKKKLNFIEHNEHGKVYPFYIADGEFKKQSNTKFFSGCALGLTSINFCVLITALGALSPANALYSFLSTHEFAMICSVLMNMHFVRKAFKSYEDTQSRVKAFFLKPNGKNIVIEKFNGEIINIESLDIYSSNIFCKYDQKVRREGIRDTNNNSLRVVMNYGRNKEVVIDGKRKFLDFEILQYVTNRFFIDTTQVGYNNENEDNKLDQIDAKILDRTVRYIKAGSRLENLYLKSFLNKRLKKRKEKESSNSIY